eukprot:gene17825-biopygen37533
MPGSVNSHKDSRSSPEASLPRSGCCLLRSGYCLPRSGCGLPGNGSGQPRRGLRRVRRQRRVCHAAAAAYCAAADAVNVLPRPLRCGRALGGPWAALAAAGACVPAPLRDAVYAYVGRNRYRCACQNIARTAAAAVGPALSAPPAPSSAATLSAPPGGEASLCAQQQVRVLRPGCAFLLRTAGPAHSSSALYAFPPPHCGQAAVLVAGGDAAAARLFPRGVRGGGAAARRGRRLRRFNFGAARG